MCTTIPAGSDTRTRAHSGAAATVRVQIVISAFALRAAARSGSSSTTTERPRTYAQRSAAWSAPGRTSAPYGCGPQPTSMTSAVRAFLALALVDTGREREAAALALVGRFAWDSASARGPGGARRRRPRADGRP